MMTRQNNRNSTRRPAPAHPDRQGAREALTEALRETVDDGREEQHAAWILPVVERLMIRYGDQRAAEALDEAADRTRLVAGEREEHPDFGPKARAARAEGRFTGALPPKAPGPFGQDLPPIRPHSA